MEEDIAVKGIIIDKDRFLLLKQVVDGKLWYALPGGRVKSEDYENELKREIKEEVSINVEIKEHIGDWFFIRESNNKKTICKTFTCKPLATDVGSKNSEDGEEIIDYIWVTKEEFIEKEYIKDQSLNELIKKQLYI